MCDGCTLSSICTVNIICKCTFCYITVSCRSTAGVGIKCGSVEYTVVSNSRDSSGFDPSSTSFPSSTLLFTPRRAYSNISISASSPTPPMSDGSSVSLSTANASSSADARRSSTASLFRAPRNETCEKRCDLCRFRSTQQIKHRIQKGPRILRLHTRNSTSFKRLVRYGPDS